MDYDVTYERIIEKFPDYDKTVKAFIELAESDEDKEIINSILKEGKYKSFVINTKLSNQTNPISKPELGRRLAIAEVALFNKGLFNFLVKNNINIYHGTKINSLESILQYGLKAHSSLLDLGIEVQSGENLMMSSSFGFQCHIRDFISCTDDFSVASNYSINCESENKKYMILGFTSKNLNESHDNGLIYVRSMMTEIGFTKDLDSDRIKIIIVSPELIEEIQKKVYDKGIPVFGYSKEYTFRRRIEFDKFTESWYIIDKKAFYSNDGCDFDEKTFEEYKDIWKQKIKDINRYNAIIDRYLEMLSTAICIKNDGSRIIIVSPNRKLHVLEVPKISELDKDSLDNVLKFEAKLEESDFDLSESAVTDFELLSKSGINALELLLDGPNIEYFDRVSDILKYYDMTEEELKKLNLEYIQRKRIRIDAEKRYHTLSDRINKISMQGKSSPPVELISANMESNFSKGIKGLLLKIFKRKEYLNLQLQEKEKRKQYEEHKALSDEYQQKKKELSQVEKNMYIEIPDSLVFASIVLNIRQQAKAIRRMEIETPKKEISLDD